jgi:hypothetical protein
MVPNFRKQHIGQSCMSTPEVIHGSMQIAANKNLVFIDIFLNIFEVFR